jgi:hypothetical protein
MLAGADEDLAAGDAVAAVIGPATARVRTQAKVGAALRLRQAHGPVSTRGTSFGRKRCFNSSDRAAASPK